ncbi:hypothetical protein FV222_19090, partial [Methylobacterium sp. WL103]
MVCTDACGADRAAARGPRAPCPGHRSAGGLRTGRPRGRDRQGADQRMAADAELLIDRRRLRRKLSVW